ncbi:unnamed protein product [Pieris brassicae]|uniref:LITAF domain-containing protein n=1 Tax=Pieris brassicae TaxID=7116 RepID=A0A9P0XBG8_PIEBR|nr:unnamed protein product [Pieris brassicae]
MNNQNGAGGNFNSEIVQQTHSETIDAPPPYTPVDTLHVPTVITNQPVIHQTIIVQQSLKDEPILIDCPSCHKRCMTKVDYANSQKTHMIAGFICGLTVWCFLCCFAALPYILRTFKKPEHYCSKCNYYFGSS